MPVDRHVERVALRVGLVGPKVSADDAHDLFLGMLEPDQMYEAHVNLIQHGRKVCHAQRPDHDACPLRARCRFVDPEGALTTGLRPGAEPIGHPFGVRAHRVHHAGTHPTAPLPTFSTVPRCHGRTARPHGTFRPPEVTGGSEDQVGTHGHFHDPQKRERTAQEAHAEDRPSSSSPSSSRSSCWSCAGSSTSGCMLYSRMGVINASPRGRPRVRHRV